MTTVTVGLADLETLVMATAIIKTIESSLAQRKDDPFIKPHLNFSDAHDRLATAMRNATRAESGTLFDWDGELSDDEIILLKDIDAGAIKMFSVSERNPANKEHYNQNIDSLAAKGCIILGQCASAVVWAGANRPELKVDPSKFAVKITDRGRQKLRMLQLKDQEKV